MNVHDAIYLACTVGGEVCARTYESLHTTIDYDGLLDLLEMNDVHQSWKAAKQKAINGD